MQLTTPIRAQLVAAYKTMATMAGHRPAHAHAAGLDAEAAAYAARWWAEEDATVFHVGVCNYETRPATVYAVEAARRLCAVQDETALALLELAAGTLRDRLATTTRTPQTSPRVTRLA